MDLWWKGANATSGVEIRIRGASARWRRAGSSTPRFSRHGRVVPDSLVDFRTGDELPEALITAVDVHQFDWRACVDGLVQPDAPSDDDEA